MKNIITIAFAFFISMHVFGQENLDSALLEASYANDRVLILDLLRKGANVNAKSSEGVTPLMYVVQNNSWSLAKILVYNGADVNISPDNGRVALITAVLNNNLDIADYLVQSGAKTDVKDYYSISPLIYASAYGYFYIVDMLLYYGGNINQTTNDGTSALLIASMNGYKNIDSLLLAKGADINCKDNEGFTPLMVACQKGNKEIVDLLLTKGADKSLTNKYGNDALMIAVQNNNTEIVDLLLKNLPDSSKIQKPKLLYKTAYINNNKKIVKKLKQNNIKSGIWPVFSTIHYGITNYFNQHDDMLGGILGIYDFKYKTSIDFSYYTRLGSKRILVDYSPTLSYQYWERRSLMALTIQKNFNLHSNNKISHGLFIGVREIYTYGKYRATIEKPDSKFILVPQLGYSLSGKKAALKLNYEYLDFKTYKVSPHHLNLELLININTFKPSKQNKSENYWLKNY